jgi:hypothetical protein
MPPLVSKIALEALGLLDMKCFEVLVPGIGFEAGNCLCHGVDGLLAVALSFGKIDEALR